MYFTSFPFEGCTGFLLKTLLLVMHKMDIYKEAVLPYLDSNRKIENSNFFLTIFWGEF